MLGQIYPTFKFGKFMINNTRRVITGITGSLGLQSPYPKTIRLESQDGMTAMYFTLCHVQIDMSCEHDVDWYGVEHEIVLYTCESVMGTWKLILLVGAPAEVEWRDEWKATYPSDFPPMGDDDELEESYDYMDGMIPPLEFGDQ